ncbi:MAG TPA: DUF5615 family PIN-like protein [Planctomycetaceae bacterium]|nr:DUF5615 family PIN-like protein [Planctomycetaceae bacterium]
MLPFAADENFNAVIVRGLLRRQPQLDVVPVQDAGLSGADDPAVLKWATEAGRLLLTHDVQTMIDYAGERLAAGLPCCAVIEVGRQVPLGVAIDEILIIAECSEIGEWDGQIVFLPLK